MIARGDGEIRLPLENGQMRGLFGDHRNRLDGRGARADDPHPQTSEADRLMRPAAGVIALAGVVRQALEFGDLRGRDAATGHHKMPGADLLSRTGFDSPQSQTLVVMRGAHFGLKIDVRSQAKAVRNMIGIGAYVGMTGELLRPIPFLLQLVVKAIGILHAFHVTTRAGIAIPVPGTSDAVTAFETARGEALFT